MFNLTIQHLDLWIDLLWRFRPKEADWAAVSPHFCQAILGGMMPTYFFDVSRYPVPWTDVEKVSTFMVPIPFAYIIIFYYTKTV